MSVFYYLGCDRCRLYGPFLADTCGSAPDGQYRFIAAHRDAHCAGTLRVVDEFEVAEHSYISWEGEDDD